MLTSADAPLVLGSSVFRLWLVITGTLPLTERVEDRGRELRELLYTLIAGCLRGGRTFEYRGDLTSLPQPAV